MHTPWGDLPVSDAHVHFFSHRFFAGLAAQKNIDMSSMGAALGWQLPDPDPVHLADHWAKQLDAFGVAKAALIASMPGDHDSVIAAVQRHPRRFCGYAMVDPTSFDSLAQTEAALASGHLSGLCFFPAMQRYSIQDERAMALIEVAAARTGTIVFVHCGVLSVGVRKKLGLPSYFDMGFSNPIDLHAVAARYPNTRFVIPHFGAGYLRETLMLCDLCPNVLLDTSSSNQWLRYEESSLDLRGLFRKVLDVIGPTRLLFGTDSSFFPRGWNRPIFEAQSKALYELGLDAEQARLILHENFARLFG